MKNKLTVFISVILTVIFCLNFNIIKTYSATELNKTLAFPDAQGGGMYSKGARGAENPEIYHVTNLADSGKGSFRDAVSKGNRFIVFDVGGNIKLNKKLNIYGDNITVLGQTAPGDGISIDNECVSIQGKNIIIRYMRFRMGSEFSEEDTVTVINGSDIILDHCSMAWSIDECLSFYAVKNFTVQWSIISESLNNSIHTKGIHGMGGIWGGINSSAHHNLLATNNNRNPMIGTGATVSSYNNLPDTDGLIDVRNNVVYNWGSSASYGGQNGVRVNLIGNYFRPGPATKTSSAKKIYTLHGTQEDSNSLPENGGTTGGGKGELGWSTTLFVDKNFVEGAADVTADNWLGVKSGQNVGIWEGSWKKCKSIQDGIYVDGVLKPNDEYIYDYPVITQSPEKAYEEVIKYAGASNKRDSVDTRVINDVINKTAPTGSKSGLGLVDSPYDVGGYPVLIGGKAPSDLDNDGIADYWEDENGYNKNDYYDALKIENDGYTPLEKYAEYLITHEQTETADKTDLNKQIYDALKIKNIGYSENSWTNFVNALQKAQNTAGTVYPSPEEIDSALKTLKDGISSLEIYEKYALKELISKAEEINQHEYMSDSYADMINKLNDAKEVYENENAQKAEIDNAADMLQKALDNLLPDYKYLLKNKVDSLSAINQMDYSLDCLNVLKNIIAEANKILENDLISQKEYDTAIKNINDFFKNKIVKSDDKETRITGDFEKMDCFNISKGTYGNYSISLSNDSDLCYIKEGIAGNSSKSLVLDDKSELRTSFMQRFEESKNGVFKFEGEFCFLSEPLTELILFRVADLNFSGISGNNFFDLSVVKSGQNSLLRCRNYTDNEMTSTIISNEILKQNTWYNVELTVDTIKKECSVSFNGNNVQIPLYMEQVAIDRYSIETPGGKSAVMAVDNLKISEINKGYDVINSKLMGDWTGGNTIQYSADIINYNEDEEIFFITVSYENGVVYDINLQELNISKKSKTENLSSSVKLAENPENCEIKIFIWNKSMKPFYKQVYKG